MESISKYVVDNGNGGSQGFAASRANASRGRYRFKLEEKFEAVVLGDYESEKSSIPNDLCEKIIQHDTTVQVGEFQKSHQLRAAIKGTE